LKSGGDERRASEPLHLSRSVFLSTKMWPLGRCWCIQQYLKLSKIQKY
jgi:hypothetical protein